ncbi:MAG: hypothetical protein AB1403_23780, partial [Candidatus Riflebacteria bacterium]
MLKFSVLARIRSWSLIFFLSILPGFIFLWDWNPEGEDNYRFEIEKQEWFSRTELCSDTFARSSEIDFWQEALCKRFSSLVSAHIENGAPFDAA